MQQRFTRIITEVNNRIRKWLPEDMGEKWMVHVEAGSVAFGSAYHKWALSVPFMKKSGITFKDVYKHCQEGTMKELAKKAPLHNVVLNMVIRHLPNPLEAQKIRVPVIWKGDLGSSVGKAMMNVDENGPVGFMVTKIIVDPQAGEAGPKNQGENHPGTGRAPTPGGGRAPPGSPVFPRPNRLKNPRAAEPADRRISRRRPQQGRPVRRQIAEQAQPLLHGGRAARGQDRRCDPRGRNRLGPAD